MCVLLFDTAADASRVVSIPRTFVLLQRRALEAVRGRWRCIHGWGAGGSRRSTKSSCGTSRLSIGYWSDIMPVVSHARGRPKCLGIEARNAVVVMMISSAIHCAVDVKHLCQEKPFQPGPGRKFLGPTANMMSLPSAVLGQSGG